MATVNSINYAKTIAVPATKINQGELNGRVKVLKDKYTLSAALTAADIIACTKLPAGALVLSAYIRSGDMGGTGQFSVGYAANGTDAADPDAFVNNSDAGDANSFTRNGASAAAAAAETGILKRFDVETQVTITVEETTIATTGDVEIVIEYVLA